MYPELTELRETAVVMTAHNIVMHKYVVSELEAYVCK